MRQKNAPAGVRVDRHPTASGAITRLAFAKAKAAGVAIEPLLKKARLTHDQINNPHAPINVRDQITFLNLVATALDDDLLGFHLTQIADLREVGLLYYVLASSKVLIDALRRGARYTSIVNEGMSQKCMNSRRFMGSPQAEKRTLPYRQGAVLCVTALWPRCPLWLYRIPGLTAFISPLALDVAAFAEALAETGDITCVTFGRPVSDKPDHRHRRLLRVRGKRPRGRRTSDKRDELAPLHCRPNAQDTGS